MKQTIRILAAENLKDIIPREGELYTTRIFELSLNEPNPVRRISAICPDIVFINMFTPGTDAVTVISSYYEIFGGCGSDFVVAASSVSSELKRELEGCSVTATIPYTCCPSDIDNILAGSCRRKQYGKSSGFHEGLASIHKIHDSVSSCTTEIKVEKILHMLGFYDSLSGYTYLKQAIVMAVENEDAMYHMTRRIYPVIAAQHSTTPSSVERKIHSTICRVWDAGHNSTLGSYFGSTISLCRGRPANSEFIAAIADRIKLFSQNAE